MSAPLLRDLRTWRFWRHFTTFLFSAVGFASAIIGVWGAFASDFVSDHGLFLIAASLGLSLIYASVRAWPRPIQQSFSTPNTRVRVIEGDLFKQDRTNLVIGTCDTFDTAPPTIIDRRSIQGQFLDRVYNGDLARLDHDLDEALADVPPVGTITKSGKNRVFPIGTVATLQQGPTQYFCLAYTNMNAHNNTHGTVDGLWQSLSALWATVSELANGAPLAMPVVGGRNARMSGFLPAQDSIRFTVLSFILASRTSPVCESLDIIVHPNDFKKLDRLELQAFLSSLRES